MPRHTKTTRRKLRCVGVATPNQILTREGVLRVFGFGRTTLDEARDSGIVNPISAGGRLFYRASEIIQWIESHQPVQRGSNGSGISNGSDRGSSSSQ